MSTSDYTNRTDDASDQKAQLGRLPYRDLAAIDLDQLAARQPTIGGLIGSQGIASIAETAPKQLAHYNQLRRDAGASTDADTLAEIEETPLWQAQLELDKAIQVLESAAEGLSHKLGPILCQMPTANAPDEVPERRPPGASEVAGNLFAMCDRLTKLGRRVEELRERCDV
jgi:hypothetical protein